MKHIVAWLPDDKKEKLINTNNIFKIPIIFIDSVQEIEQIIDGFVIFCPSFALGNIEFANILKKYPIRTFNPMCDLYAMDFKTTMLMESFKDLIPDNPDVPIILLQRFLDMNTELFSGVFWVITDTKELTDWKLLPFKIHCDSKGNVIEETPIMLNAKSGRTYNHKLLWENEIKNNPDYKPYNKKEYNYYPRGRIDISNNKATIYLNPFINIPEIIEEIKQKFGLTTQNISEVRVVSDGSKHYECFIDWE